VKSIDKIAACDGEIVLLEQNAEKSLYEFKIDENKNYYFVFGPEGGLTSEELEKLKNAKQFKLTESRLRSETAITACASLLTAIHINE
jgi:RsmE family RNA methyltransferase